jgi:hypothetical protein
MYMSRSGRGLNRTPSPRSVSLVSEGISKASPLGPHRHPRIPWDAITQPSEPSRASDAALTLVNAASRAIQLSTAVTKNILGRAG